MEKYITSIENLVIQAMTNGEDMRNKAEKGESKSCFQMGMRYLVGANVTIDFNKSRYYFENHTLADNPEALLLLGLMSEYEGDFARAFHYYATAKSNEFDSYIENIVCGRESLQKYLKELSLPILLNEEITILFKDYKKNKASKLKTVQMIATICEDELSCLEAAKNSFLDGNYYTSICWLKKSKTSDDNELYIALQEKITKAKTDLLKSKKKQMIEVNNNSLLGEDCFNASFLTQFCKTCNKVSKDCKNEWIRQVDALCDTIIKEQEYLQRTLVKNAEEVVSPQDTNRKYVLVAFILAAIIASFIIIKLSINSSMFIWGLITLALYAILLKPVKSIMTLFE